MCTPPRVEVGFTARWRWDARALARACCWRWIEADCSCRSAIACAGVPRRVILNLGDERGRVAESGSVGNGAFFIPGFGAIRSFWFAVGMFRVASIWSERSWRFADAEIWKVWGVP